VTRVAFKIVLILSVACSCVIVPFAEDVSQKITPRQTALSINGISLGMSREEVFELVGEVETLPDKIGQKMSAPQSWNSPRVNFGKDERATLIVGNLLSVGQNRSIGSGQEARKVLDLIGPPEIKKPIGVTLELWEYSTSKLTVHVYKETETIEWFTLALTSKEAVRELKLHCHLLASRSYQLSGWWVDISRKSITRFAPYRSPVPDEVDHFLAPLLAGYLPRSESPFISILTAVLTSLSSKASATLGSAVAPGESVGSRLS
jgi:hypothetical protein